jgi:NADPH-dependent 2,4-dienoyl-CoA reductase/sulfur reductase-like enzyme/nitrite reductase/ring-hydroxylating ferredoxin subunit
MPDRAHFVARLADFPDGSMRQVQIGATKVLVVRRGDDVFAMDGACPHAGGTLAEGVLAGDRVICPWHKAAFHIASGACLEPPAVDDLRHYPVGIRDGEILVTLEAPVRPAPNPPASQDPRRFIILGGGAAGTAAAQTLRAEGFARRILMIDREGAPPYDRTLLSKTEMSGRDSGEKSPLHAEDFYGRHGIDRLTGEVATLDAGTRVIRLADGTELVYDAALIATGGMPVEPTMTGADLSNVFLLRSRSDLDHILAAAERGRRAVVVGASFIGMEAAASLRERGLEVTVVAERAEPFEAQLGPRIGAVFRRLHEARGVRFRLGRRVERLMGDGAVSGVALADGEVLETDLVVAGLGVRPATGFVHDLPVGEDGGLKVDRSLKLADRLYAAGDVAAFPLHGDGPLTRVEHWRVAEQHGRLAALNMMGDERPYDAVPYFWTIQFMNRLDYVGHGAGDDELVVRGDLDKPEFVAYYLRDGRVRAAAGWARHRDMAALTVLLGERHDWTVDALHPEGGSPATVLADREAARRLQRSSGPRLKGG